MTLFAAISTFSFRLRGVHVCVTLLCLAACHHRPSTTMTRFGKLFARMQSNPTKRPQLTAAQRCRVQALMNEARSLYHRHQFAAAIKVYKSVLTVCQTYLGPGHRDTLIAATNLGLSLRLEGLFDEAHSVHVEVRLTPSCMRFAALSVT